MPTAGEFADKDAAGTVFLRGRRVSEQLASRLCPC